MAWSLAAIESSMDWQRESGREGEREGGVILILQWSDLATEGWPPIGHHQPPSSSEQLLWCDSNKQLDLPHCYLLLHLGCLHLTSVPLTEAPALQHTRRQDVQLPGCKGKEKLVTDNSSVHPPSNMILPDVRMGFDRTPLSVK